jgi:hypothetical protein
MKKLFVFITALFFMFSFSSNAEIKQDAKFDKMIGEIEGKISGKSFSEIPHKQFILDKALAKQKSNNIFKSNPIAMSSSKPVIESENEKEYIFKSGPIEYRLSKVANCEMLLNLNRYTVAEKTNLIDSNRAIQIASSYIEKHMDDIQKNELSYSKVVSIVISGAQGDGKGNIKGKIQEDIANYIVMFDRVIDNIPIIGPGGKIRVYLARNGEVIGHSKLWRQLEKGNNNLKKVISPREAKTIISGKILSENSPDVSPELKSMKFGYFEAGRNKKQDFSSPMYEIEYNYGSHSKRVIAYLDGYSGASISNSEELLQGDPK